MGIISYIPAGVYIGFSICILLLMLFEGGTESNVLVALMMSTIGFILIGMGVNKDYDTTKNETKNSLIMFIVGLIIMLLVLLYYLVILLIYIKKNYFSTESKA